MVQMFYWDKEHKGRELVKRLPNVFDEWLNEDREETFPSFDMSYVYMLFQQ